ncbi:MAG: hypothetical protein SGPRY_011271, partial [Prymnesium sp.]
VELLANSTFGTSGYYPNNFNDLASGVVTLFELLVVNNWFVIASGFEAVLGPHARWWASSSLFSPPSSLLAPCSSLLPPLSLRPPVALHSLHVIQPASSVPSGHFMVFYREYV